MNKSLCMLALCVWMCACPREESPQAAVTSMVNNHQRVLDDGIYLQDEQTHICFFSVRQATATGQAYGAPIFITYVPCTDEVQRKIDSYRSLAQQLHPVTQGK